MQDKFLYYRFLFDMLYPNAGNVILTTPQWRGLDAKASDEQKKLALQKMSGKVSA